MSGQIQHAMDVVVVDMADHEETNGEDIDVALLPERLQPRSQRSAEHAGRAAVDEGQAVVTPMQEQAVAVFGL